jgi:hypothetical protein
LALFDPYCSLLKNNFMLINQIWIFKSKSKQHHTTNQIMTHMYRYYKNDDDQSIITTKDETFNPNTLLINLVPNQQIHLTREQPANCLQFVCYMFWPLTGSTHAHTHTHAHACILHVCFNIVTTRCLETCFILRPNMWF